MGGPLAGRAGAAALALLVLAGPLPAAGEAVPLREVPRPVRDAVQTRFPDARILRAERDREGGAVVYEVTLRHQGRALDVTLTPEGTVRLIKREVAAGEVPEPVARALRDAYPGATWQVIEAVSRVQGAREELSHYEVDLMTARWQRLEVAVGPDGALRRGPEAGRAPR